MTEEEYDSCQNIRKLEAAAGATRTISVRRVRLFAHACAQRLGHLLTRPEVVRAIDTAFRFADEAATEEDLLAGRAAVREAASKAPRNSKWDDALRVVLYATTLPDHFSIAVALDQVAHCVCRALAPDPDAHQREMARCCDLFRDLFPYHAPHQPTARPPWAGGEVGHVARTIYEEGRFEDMPILADALEDAGCDRPELVAHCRESGLHIRGCWAVDLILGLT